MSADIALLLKSIIEELDGDEPFVCTAFAKMADD